MESFIYFLTWYVNILHIKLDKTFSGTSVELLYNHRARGVSFEVRTYFALKVRTVQFRASLFAESEIISLSLQPVCEPLGERPRRFPYGRAAVMSTWKAVLCPAGRWMLRPVGAVGGLPGGRAWW